MTVNPENSEIFTCVCPSCPTGIIEDLIKRDCQAGQYSKICYVAVNPLMAVTLFLEGKLTAEHVAKAQLCDDVACCLRIVLPDMEFSTPRGTKKFPIIVVADTGTAAMTVAEGGAMV